MKWKLCKIREPMNEDARVLLYTKFRRGLPVARMAMKLTGLEEIRCGSKANVQRAVRSRIKRGKWIAHHVVDPNFYKQVGTADRKVMLWLERRRTIL